MTSPAAQMIGLRKIFKKTLALDGLSLTFPRGRLIGFLGPNGAGKTTTFRILLGLARPNAGTASLLGVDTSNNLQSVIGRVGAMVEGPALYDTLSGRDNLVVAQRSRGDGGDIVGTLDLIGLAERADDKVSGYSKGMKQRLALGMALLNDPELLLLDEPMDGLDPAGQKTLRELLRRLVDGGKTVVVSSHVLADIQALADYVVIINRGRLVAEGSVAELIGTDKTRIGVDSSESDEALTALAQAGITASTRGERIYAETLDARAAGRALADAGVYPFELIVEKRGLEQVFLELTEADR